jgi:hypothetical protein
MISGFRLDLAENSASSDNFSPTFRVNLFGPILRVKECYPEGGTIGCSERNYRHSLLIHPEERSTPAWKFYLFPTTFICDDY